MKKYAFYAALFVLTLGVGALAGDFTYDVPTAGVTPGPTWASQISSALTILKTHTHTGTATEGPTLGTAAIVENATHQMNNNTISEIDGLTFNDGTSNSPSNYSLYLSSNELYYKDESGNAIQLTSGSAPRMVGTYSTTRYLAPWAACQFSAHPVTVTNHRPVYDTGTSTWAAFCSIPAPNVSGVTITNIHTYWNMGVDGVDCRLSGTLASSTAIASAMTSVLETKTNEAMADSSYVTSSFTTDITMDGDTVVSIYIAPNDSAATTGCDTLTFLGLGISYSVSAAGAIDAWNY